MAGEVMYDSTTASDIPPGAPVVGGYIDGLYAWSEEDWARHETAKKVHISVKFTDAGDDLDIENGDATIAQAPSWVVARQKSGVRRPWLYIARSSWLALITEIHDKLGPGTEVGYHVADWTGEPHPLECQGIAADAVQFASPETGSGGHFDLSLVYGTLPSEEPAPAPTTTPAPAPAPSPGGSDVQVPELRSGAQGQPVRAVQSILNGKAGARLVTDGSFGPKTDAAVRAWQTFFHLGVDGIVGPATWTTLIDL